MIQELPFKDRKIIPIIKDELVEGCLAAVHEAVPSQREVFPCRL